MKLRDFEYVLPEELIAAYPTKARDESRLLILGKDSGRILHRRFDDVADYLSNGDILVLNNSKVFPARLIGEKATGGKAEILLDHEDQDGEWEAIGKNIKEGAEISFGHGLKGKISHKFERTCLIKFNKTKEILMKVLEEIGRVPLPPYVEQKRMRSGIEFKEDKDRYQTVYAKERGSTAAPTAGLHFTKELLNKIEERGAKIVYLTLHVGLGTFLPVEADIIQNHTMHKEFFSIGKEALTEIMKAKARGNKVFAVGTTTTRVLETVFDKPLTLNSELLTNVSGWTDIFIYPGYKFKCIDGLITNFHLPKSTLLMLASAFAGHKNIMKAYQEAVKQKYRFYSYGDAVLIK